MDLVEFHNNLSEGRFDNIIQQIERYEDVQDDILLILILFLKQQKDDAYSLCTHIENEIVDKEPIWILRFNISEFLIYADRKNSDMKSKSFSKIIEVEEKIDLSYDTIDNVFWKSMIRLVKGINFENNNSAKAITLINQTIDEFQQILHRFMEYYATFKTLKILETQGKYAEAIDRFTVCIKIWEEMELPDWVGTGYNGLGEVYRASGQYDQAEKQFMKALEIFKMTGNNSIKAISFNNLGIINYFTGHYREGLNYYSQSLEIFHGLGNKEGVSAAYGNMGIMHTMLTEYIDAEKFFKMSLTLEKEMINTRAIAKVSNNLGNLVQMQGKFTEAMELYSEAITHYGKVDDKNGVATAHHNTAFCYNAIGETNKALDHAKLALEARLKLKNDHLIGRSYKLMGDLLYKIGDMEASVSYLEKSLDILRKIGNEPQVAETALSIVEAYIANDQVKEVEIIVKQLDGMAKSSDVRFVDQISKYITFLLAKTQDRGNKTYQSTEVRNGYLAQLDEILKDDPHTVLFEIEINLRKIEILLAKFNEEENIDTKRLLLQNVQNIADELQLKVEKEQNYDVQIKLFVVQARISRLTGEVDKTMAYLDTAYAVAINQGLNLLTEIIELEMDYHQMQITAQKQNSTLGHGNVELDIIGDLERFIHYIKQDIGQYYEGIEFHYFQGKKTLCGLDRAELHTMEIEYNLPKTTITKCSQCRQKLFDDALHSIIGVKIMSETCPECDIIPNADQVDLIITQNIKSGKIRRYETTESLGSNTILQLDWVCVNQICKHLNEIKIDEIILRNRL